LGEKQLKKEEQKHMEKIRKTLDLNVDVIERVEKYRLDNQFSTFTSALNHFLFISLPPVSMSRPKFTFDHAVSCLLVRKTQHGKTREAIDPYFQKLLAEAEAHYSEEEIKEMILQHYAHREKTWEELLEA
jgi:hypothetical protein